MARQPRPIRIEGDIAYVPLTKGYEAVIDAADVPLVEGTFWQALVEKRTIYARCSVYKDGKKRTALMHRIIAGTPEGFETDHIDGDGLNNRRANLRSVTKTQNMRNRRRELRNTSGVKGVNWIPKGKGRWRARIRIEGKDHHLGCFVSKEAAAAAYARASAEHHGEFGRLA